MSGTLVVLEGLDGSGKATQAALLTEHLAQAGRSVRQVSFPNYESPSSALVRMYLAGEIGSLETVNVYAASSFYSLDRYVSYQTDWRDFYQAGGTIVADRYTTSNICHQMGKLSREKWESYLKWLTDYEYTLLGLPQPARVLYLDMHPQASRLLLEGRYHGDEGKLDLHEQNLAYLLSCREAALYAAQLLGWDVLTCSDAQHRPIAAETIAAEIFRLATKPMDQQG